MTFRLGLTGSIGTGKSTTAQMFRKAGCPVWDADEAVHRLYARNGSAVEAIGRVYPAAVVNDSISRTALKTIISDDPSALRTLEQIVHPLVARDRELFLQNTEADIMVFDIPLLYENGTEEMMDAVVVTTIPPDVQRDRVMQRGTMTEGEFEHILRKQIPDDEKRARAEYVIVTDTVEHATTQVQNVLADIRRKMTHA